MARDRYVTRKELAELQDVDERTVTNWVRDHADFPSRIKGKNRTFPMRLVQQWRLKFEAKPAIASVAGDEADSTRRKKAADATTAEIELQKLQGELIPRQFHRDRLAEVCRRLADVVRGGLNEFGTKIECANSPGEAARVIEEIRDTMLAKLSGVGIQIQGETSILVPEPAAIAAPAPPKKAKKTKKKRGGTRGDTAAAA